jgi:predicted Zn-dependent protease
LFAYLVIFPPFGFFQKIHDFSRKLIAESPGSEVLKKLESIEILRSHPNTEKRISYLNSSIKELEKKHQFRTLAVDWNQFQKKVKENF